jgi:hypothetical protein
MDCHVEPKAKHLAFVREILRFAQNDTPQFICDGPISYKLPKELYIILDKRNWIPAFAGMTKGTSAINK